MAESFGFMSTSTSGTGDLTVAAVTNHVPFNAVIPLNKRFRYELIDHTTRAPICAGIGYLSSSTNLKRGSVEKLWNGTTYDDAGSPVSLSGAAYDVFCAPLGNDIAPTFFGVQGSYGQKLVLPNGLLPSNQSNTTTANIIYASALEWVCAQRITSLAVQISGTAVGTSSNKIQLGVYDCAADGSPGNLLFRSATILPNSLGFKTASLFDASGSSISYFNLTPGYYYWSLLSDVAPTYIAYDAGSDTKMPSGGPMGMVSSLIYRRIAYLESTSQSGWSNMPATFSLNAAREANGYFTPTVGAIVA